MFAYVSFNPFNLVFNTNGAERRKLDADHSCRICWKHLDFEVRDY
ncbi:hypothetical protein SAMN06265348_109125 [Pedobacter westerhofensis]|uniref:Uncharacterized protein n=1 Tax=Pedobacter westerhofensis TaxID=425512 RepID=A0A521ETU0_9SPHI|nr:hypothetical protein SAMN06265348_109125 [Pedobacter westerhofensis]